MCRCGAAKCRRTMKGGGKSETESSSTKSTAAQIWEAAKAGLERDCKFQKEVLDSARMLQCGKRVPGSNNVEELVTNGPQNRNRVPPNIIASSSGEMLFRSPILPVGWTRSYDRVPTVVNI